MAAITEIEEICDPAALDSLGLGDAVLAVYREMLRTPDAPLAQIAGVLDIDEDRVRQALDLLVTKDLLRPSQGDGGWRPISPEVALRRLVAEATAEVQAQQERLGRLRDGVEAFVDDYRRAREERIASQVEHLDTPDAVVGVLEELNERVTSEILAFVTNRPTPTAVEQSRQSDEATLAKGVEVRSIHLEGVADKVFREHAEWLAERGAQVRLAPTLPLRMIVFDRSVAVVAVDPGDPGAGAIVLRGKGMIAALVALFELQWEAARSPFEEAPPVEGDALSPMDAEVLRLLAKGLKDDSVARHLGVSVRTARRLIADLTERAGAGSRFELGVRAKELGWL